MDERRLYDVGAGGAARTQRETAEEQARRLNRLRWLLAGGLGVNAASWTAAGAALVLGGRAWGAAFGTLALATLPVLVLPLAVEGLARLTAYRRHARRPGSFGET